MIFSEDAPGCRVDDGHVRCEMTAAALEHFPQTGDTTTGLRRRGALFAQRQHAARDAVHDVVECGAAASLSAFATKAT